MERQKQAVVEVEPSSSSDDVWMKIWKLEVPPKIRVFWWRVIHQFLPCRSIMHNRHVEHIANCEVCGDPEESIRHVLIDCTVARMFWKHAKKLIGIKLPQLHPLNWARDLLSNICSRKDAAIIICGMWALWSMKNKRRHGEVWLLRQAVTWIKDTAFDLWSILKQTGNHGDRRRQMQWIPPVETWTKCNVDGNFFTNSREGGTGAVLRDSKGNFRGAKAVWHERCLDAMTMEALACQEGLVLARQCGVQRIHLETDCLELVRLWELGDLQRSTVSPILKEMKNISSDFLEFRFSFANRDCNRVAHLLARQVSSTNRWAVWHEAPTCVSHLLQNDCSSIC